MIGDSSSHGNVDSNRLGPNYCCSAPNGGVLIDEKWQLNWFCFTGTRGEIFSMG